MKKSFVFGRRIVAFIFLIFTGIVFADTSAVTNVLHKEHSSRSNAKHSLTTCRGINILPASKKVVALTFDDGPSKVYTPRVLGILKQNNIKGTFFFIGSNVKEYPEIVSEAYKNGNIIGNHSYSHSYLNRLDGEDIEYELTRTSALIKKVIGVYPLLFRPPYGACSAGSVRVARNLNLKTIMWSAMVDDYHVDRTTSEKIASQILGLIHPGAVIGLHDGGGNREKSVEALQIIIEALRKEGYSFVTIPELLGVQPYAISEQEEKPNI